jgi:hypothetical protein
MFDLASRKCHSQFRSSLEKIQSHNLVALTCECPSCGVATSVQVSSSTSNVPAPQPSCEGTSTFLFTKLGLSSGKPVPVRTRKLEDEFAITAGRRRPKAEDQRPKPEDQPLPTGTDAFRSFILTVCPKTVSLVRSSYFSCPSVHSNLTGASGPRSTDSARA